MTRFWINFRDGVPLVIEADALTDLGKGLICYVNSFCVNTVDIGLFENPDCIQEKVIKGQKTLILRTANYRDEAQKVVWDKEVARHQNTDGGNVFAPSP